MESLRVIQTVENILRGILATLWELRSANNSLLRLSGGWFQNIIQTERKIENRESKGNKERCQEKKSKGCLRFLTPQFRGMRSDAL